MPKIPEIPTQVERRPHPEGRHRPDSRCLHPERYTARDIVATENEVLDLVWGVVRALQPDYVIETGTYLGDGSRRIGEALRENGHGVLDTLEMNRERAEAAGRYLDPLGLPIRRHVVSSLEFEPAAPIEFAWLDSHPSARGKEFRRFYPHFARTSKGPSAIVGFHDTGERHRVREIVERFAAEGMIRPIHFYTWRGVALCEVV